MRHVIREIALAHCKRGPSRCEACREAAGTPRWCLLDVDPPDRGMVQRRVIEVRGESGSEWREFDVVRIFADEAEARAHAREHGIDEALFPGD
ncbi:MAG: hypothetical protein MUE73_10915 [Planctomycetes bacterium]|nr:hypothetical protein [Planctomycetota bacterium]